MGHHFGSTDRGCAVPVRVYLGRGEPGTVDFADVTDEVGVPGFTAKAPHVELVDLDDDGRLDVLTTASAAGGDAPAVLRNVGEAGELRLEAPPGLGEAAYWVTGATGDFDGDGHLDVFAVENDPALPSRLWRGGGDGGAVEVAVPLDANGVGAVVEVYEAGSAGEAGALLARREVVVGRGYAAGGSGFVHVGIGERAAVDVLVRTRDGTERRAEGVPAGTRLTHPADLRG